jgi:hypothetical protein
MSFQTQQYIEEMQKMYETIMKKEFLSLTELAFLEIYKRTINGSISA